MPYIKRTDRKKYEPYLRRFAGYATRLDWLGPQATFVELQSDVNEIVALISTEGELNYNLSWLSWKYFDSKRSYSRANEITDSLNKVYDKLFVDSDVELSTHYEVIVYKLCIYKSNPVFRTRGVLRDVEAEFRRRRVDLYEDEKINTPENGDLEFHD